MEEQNPKHETNVLDTDGHDHKLEKSLIDREPEENGDSYEPHAPSSISRVSHGEQNSRLSREG